MYVPAPSVGRHSFVGLTIRNIVLMNVAGLPLMQKLCNDTMKTKRCDLAPKGIARNATCCFLNITMTLYALRANCYNRAAENGCSLKECQ